MCFPRILAFDRLRGRAEVFANCGAVAGTLARLDEQRSPLGSRARTRNCCCASARGRSACSPTRSAQRLAAHGINPLQSLRSASPRALPLRTLAGGAAASADRRGCSRRSAAACC